MRAVYQCPVCDWTYEHQQETTTPWELACKHECTQLELVHIDRRPLYKTPDDIRWMLRQRAQALGSQKRYAQRLGVSQGYLSDVLLGRRPVHALAQKLGYERRVVYVKAGDGRGRQPETGSAG